MANYIEKVELTDVPVIALRGIVAFPAVQINLEILRPISLQAFSAAASGDLRVLLLAQKNPEVDEPGERDFYKMGTICTIKQVVKNTDGNLAVTFEGVCRARVHSLQYNGKYWVAEALCRQVAASNLSENRMDALMAEVTRLLDDLKGLCPALTEELRLTALSIKDPGLLADFLASSLLGNFRNRQYVLDTLTPLTRLEKLITLLSEEADILHTEFEIHRRVKERMDEHQREFFLREQMKAIQNELGEEPDEIEEYNDRIDAAHLPREVDEKLRKELSKLAKTPFGAAESVVLRNYLDTCLEIPFSHRTAERLDVAHARRVLDEDHDGLEKVKERILEYIAARHFSDNVKNQILCLVGPPGIGKTSIAASIARALKRNYVRVSLGGIRDEADIRGHRKTYVGAMPGRIVDALISAGSMNPLIVLDEIDKLTRSIQGDPSSALLEVLDPEQNKHFRDHFIEIPLDLSDCMFIATANDYDGIPTPLLDRMEIIELPTYSRREKCEIAEHHLIPKQLHRHGLSRRQLCITTDAVYELIDSYTREAGVRNLEREIASLCRKAAMRLTDNPAKVTVRADNLREFLGKRKVLSEKIPGENPVGIVNGLAYTKAGGDLLKVEVILMEGTGKVELTGSLGDVMKESAHIAISYIRSIADTLKIPTDFYKTKDIHIHFPEGATPKDGPSAGVAMICALASALTGRRVRRDVAMTGEITLHGRVLPIGGLKEKTLAAAAAGVKTVLIPADNDCDMDEIDRDVKASLEFVFCKTVNDALAIALLPEETKEVNTSETPTLSGDLYQPNQPVIGIRAH